MKWKPKVFSLLTSIIISNANAGIMREDVSVQDYRDFAENLGKYTPGAENVEVFKTDGTSAGILDFPIPDFGASDDSAVATLVAPSYIVSVAHNTGYGGVKFGNGAKYSVSYKIINRNVDPAPGKDFHIPRLNKVVTDIAPPTWLYLTMRVTIKYAINISHAWAQDLNIKYLPQRISRYI